MKLLPYQKSSADSAIEWFFEDKNRPLIILIAKDNKKFVVAELSKSEKVTMVIHIKEFFKNNYKKLLANKRDVKIVFGDIRSMHKNEPADGQVDLFIADRGLLIESECNCKLYFEQRDKD